MQETDSCKNCFFFKPHYSVDDGGRYYILDTGHCTCKTVPIMTFRRCMKYQCACRDWRLGEEINPQESLSESVFAIKRLLEEIAKKME